MKLRILTLCALVFCLWSTAEAQYTQVGSGAFVGLDNSPLATVSPSPFFNKTAYIYTQGTIQNIRHGDTIRAISFLRNGTDSLRDPVNFKIYLRNVPYAAFDSGALNWDSLSRVSGTKKVFDASPKEAVGNGYGWAQFSFDPGDYYVFDTSAGVHLQVMMHYTQQINQPDTIQWYMESRFSVPQFSSINESKYLYGGSSRWNDSMTIGSSMNKPTIRIHHPGAQAEVEIRNLYALDKVPLRMGRPDTIRVIVENTGKDTLYDYPFYLDVVGVNNFKDTVRIDTLLPFRSRIVRFIDYLPQNQGYEELTVRCPSDAINTNNQVTVARTVTYATFSHFNAQRGAAGGGIGFTPDSGEMVARYHVDGTRKLQWVQVGFNRTNVPFRLLVYSAGADGLPDSLLYVSNVLQTIAGNENYLLDSAVSVEGDFYVGLRQSGFTSLNVRFQYERPIRPHTFYYTEVGSSDWIDFDPYIPFNFAMHPRLQVHNDVAVTRIIFPTEGMSMRYSSTDSLIPRVGFRNVGSEDQDSLLGILRIKDAYGTEVYSSTRYFDLESDSSVALDFDPFSRFRIGTFTMEAEVQLSTDSVYSNNTYSHDFELFKSHDVSVSRIFEPADGDTFEVFTEGFWPQVRVVNYGKSDQTNFPVVARLKKDGEAIDSQTLMIDLEGYNSTIIVFDSIYPSKGGNLEYEVYTDLFRDSFRSNDTLISRIYSRVSNDVSLDTVFKPSDNQRFAVSSTFKPLVQIRNEGFNDQDSVWVYARITDSKDSVLYEDSVLKSVLRFSAAQALFSSFQTPSAPQSLKFRSWIRMKDDLFADNNEATTSFEVVYPRDLRFTALEYPEDAVLFRLGEGPDSLVFTIVNEGLDEANDVPLVLVHQLPSGAQWSDTIYIDQLASGDTIRMTYTGLNADTAGAYGILLYNARDNEQFRDANDTLSSTYLVRFSKDLAITAIASPVDSTYNLKDSIPVSIRIHNLGADSAMDARMVIQIVDNQDIVIGSDTLVIPELATDQQVWVNGDALSDLLEGDYRLRTFLHEADDHPQNDSLEQFFAYRILYDAAIDSSKLPKAGGTLRYRYTHQPAVYISNKGIRDMDSILVGAKVEVNGNVIYERTRRVALDSGQNALILLDSNLRYPEVTTARASFWLAHQLDAVKTNDTMSFSFIFSEKASILGLEDHDLVLYPNPYSGSFTIRSSLPMERIHVRDAAGRLIATALPSSAVYTWENDWKPGVYWLEVWTGNEIYSVKVIKVL